MKDAGYGEGKNYAINFPLHDGMDDEAYRTVFRPVIGKVMETFQPGAIVLQVGGVGFACMCVCIREEGRGREGVEAAAPHYTPVPSHPCHPPSTTPNTPKHQLLPL